MILREADVRVLACPTCPGRLHFDGTTDRGVLASGDLVCDECARVWPVVDGLPHLLEERAVVGKDRFLRPIYDFISPFHDAAVDVVLPILQYPDSAATRDHYIARLELERLDRPRHGRPVRILEVGIGGGANLPLIESALPDDLDVELWGVDLSVGMIRQCMRRLRWFPVSRHVRLLLADAHALPFADATFDRVFHVGGINGYRDARLGLAEMARVARAGTPIVVVDEELDPGRSHGLHHWLAFRAITIWDSDPRAPRDRVPEGASHVEVTAVSRFYYCLRFQMPDPAPAATTATIGGIPMADVTKILTAAELTRIVDEYDVDQMTAIIGTTLPSEYPPSLGYVQEIGKAFYGVLPDDEDPPPRDKLSLRDRERCSIALLAGRGEGRNLALHMYIALANEVSPGEIAHIVFLAGVYCGIPHFASGLEAEILLLQTLKEVLDAGTASPGIVYQALRGAFPR